MDLYSPEWVDAFNRVAAEVTAAPDTGDGDEDGGDFRLLQIVHDGPEGTLRIGLASAGGRVVMTREPPDDPAPQVTLFVAYDDAVALSRGDTDPARLVAGGRVKVRGDLSVLVGGQALLSAVAARVAGLPRPPAA